MRARLEATALEGGKAVVVAPVFDTIKRVEGELVRATLDRDRLARPVAWGCRPELAPCSDPPPADWFEGATVLS